MKTASQVVLALFFMVAGVAHFFSAETYLQLMPAYLPWHLALIYISGVAEIAGGIGVLVPFSRRMAAWGLIVLLLAIFPANVHGALNGMTLHGMALPGWALWLRLPLQGVLIYWVYRVFLIPEEENLK